jgi:hypothetical protein
MHSDFLALPKTNRRKQVSGRIFLIVIFSVLAGSWLQKALLHYLRPRQPYEWTGDLIMGIGFLFAAFIFALRLRRDVNSSSQRAQELTV